MSLSTIGETPFRSVYGTDALVPTEIGEPSFRQQHYDEASNIENMMVELDLVQETCGQAKIVVIACKLRMTMRFNTKLRPI